MHGEQPAKRKRLACDRCHFQKLRCPKQPGQGSCGRCERLGTACVFSPVNRTVRLVPRGVRGSSDIDFASLNNAYGGDWIPEGSLEDCSASFTWPTTIPELTDPVLINLDPELSPEYDLSGLIDGQELPSTGSEYALQPENAYTSVETISPKEMGPSDKLKEADTTSPPYNILMKSSYDSFLLKSKLFSRDPGGSLEQETPEQIACWLSELSLYLAQHAAISARRVAFLKKQREDPNAEADSKEDKRKFNFDDTLNLTQYLVDIYPLFFAAFLSANPAKTSLEGQLSPAAKNDLHPSTPGFADISSILLLISCHQRLIDVWSAVLPFVKTYLRKAAIFDDSGRLVPMQVFKCSTGETVPGTMVRMSIMLTCQLCAQLVQQSSEFLGKLKGAELDTARESTQTMSLKATLNDNGNDSALDGAISACANLRQRAEVLDKEMNDLRQQIMG